MTQFTTFDTIIVICYMIVLICVGIWTAKKTKTTEDFMVAGRNIGIWRFTAAMAACVIGGSLTMGSSTLAYNFGVGAIWLGGICALSIFLLSLFLRTKLSDMRILLFIEDNDIKTARILDLIQINMRKNYDSDFLIPECSYGIAVDAAINGNRYLYDKTY